MLHRHAHLAALLCVFLSLDDRVVGTCTPNKIVYARLNASVNIDIPGIQFADGDTVKWTKGKSQLIVKSRLQKDGPDFTLFRNGTLQLTRFSEPETNITVEVSDKGGVTRNTCSLTLIGLVPVSKPVIKHKCNNMSVNFSCQVEHGTADTLQVLMAEKQVAEGKSGTTVTGSIPIPMDTNIPLKCVVKNVVSTESAEVVMLCPSELDILFIACIVGACVVFIVFMLLLIYCARRCCKQCHLRQISEEEVELPSMRTPHEARHRRLPEPRHQPTHQPQHHPQPQPRQQLQQQQRKRTQHKTSSHKKMVADQHTMQQNRQQGQAASQHNRLQGQAASQHNRLQGQAVSQLNISQGQAVSQQKMVQDQAMSQPNMSQGQAVSQQKMVQDQAMSQQNRQQGQPVAQQRMLQGQPVPQHMVQVYPAPQQPKTQGQLAPQHKQLPELPPHHPSSVSQETIPRPPPHAQPKPPPHRTAEHQQHT